jgi:hypothetical protein
MDAFLAHPAVQGAIAPFAAGLAVALVLGRFNLAGLAVAAGFGACAYLLNGLAFEPLNATRKIILLTLAAAAVGVVVDGVARTSRTAGPVAALAGGAAAIWAFWPALVQRPLQEALASGAIAAIAVAATVWLGHGLRDAPVRAGSAALGLGIGAGVAAILGASATYGLYGIAIGAGAGAFLLRQIITNRRTAAGTTLTLPAAAGSALLAAGTVLLAKLAWYALAPLVLIPLAARLPVPERAPLWLQAVFASAYALVAAAAAWALAWPGGNGY